MPTPINDRIPFASTVGRDAIGAATPQICTNLRSRLYSVRGYATSFSIMALVASDAFNVAALGSHGIADHQLSCCVQRTKDLPRYVESDELQELGASCFSCSCQLSWHHHQPCRDARLPIYGKVYLLRSNFMHLCASPSPTSGSSGRSTLVAAGTVAIFASYHHDCRLAYKRWCELSPGHSFFFAFAFAFESPFPFLRDKYSLSFLHVRPFI